MRQFNYAAESKANPFIGYSRHFSHGRIWSIGVLHYKSINGTRNTSSQVLPFLSNSVTRVVVSGVVFNR